MAKFIGRALTFSNQFQACCPEDDPLHAHVMENNRLGVLMDVVASLPHSATLSNPLLPQLNGDDIRKWVKYWRWPRPQHLLNHIHIVSRNRWCLIQPVRPNKQRKLCALSLAVYNAGH